MWPDLGTLPWLPVGGCCQRIWTTHQKQKPKYATQKSLLGVKPKYGQRQLFVQVPRYMYTSRTNPLLNIRTHSLTIPIFYLLEPKVLMDSRVGWKFPVSLATGSTVLQSTFKHAEQAQPLELVFHTTSRASRSGPPSTCLNGVALPYNKLEKKTWKQTVRQQGQHTNQLKPTQPWQPAAMAHGSISGKRT